MQEKQEEDEGLSRTSETDNYRYSHLADKPIFDQRLLGESLILLILCDNAPINVIPHLPPPGRSGGSGGDLTF